MLSIGIWSIEYWDVEYWDLEEWDRPNLPSPRRLSGLGVGVKASIRTG